ncbi:MAG: sugar ABC transporter substrate-binding protein [Propionibacteriaceae bacterium]|nr:sugar ABC transporter substrate-binding protein [Propionibacteriaceae bacterium]
MKYAKKILAAIVATALLPLIAACGSSDTPVDPSSESVNAKTEITVWGWEPTLKDVVPAFEAANPDIKVNLQNVGGAGDTYTKLDNAIAAGSGAPDISQIEYYAIAQYAIPGQLADLAEFGADSLSGTFTAGTWNSVTLAGSGKVYGLPVDSGPMALFYNKATYDEAGVTEAPKTWDEFYDAAKKIHALGPDYYITADNGDAGMATSMMWLAGAQPFKVGTDSVTIDLGAAGVVDFAEFWQKLIDEELINTKISSWSDDWFKALGDGTLASLITGAWMPANLIGSAPDAAGDFRVAATPVPTAGKAADSENGGSSLALLASSDKKEAAYKFLEFNSAGAGVAIRVKGGNFPSTLADLQKTEFLDYTDEYFGGQQYNQVLAQAAKDVLPGWSYLPYQVYANSIFGDKIAGAYSGIGTLADAFKAWGVDLVAYGQQNGFNAK